MIQEIRQEKVSTNGHKRGKNNQTITRAVEDSGSTKSLISQNACTHQDGGQLLYEIEGDS